MATTYKFKVILTIKSGSTTQRIEPIIEATSNSEAIKIAKAQYPTGYIITASQIR
jgi:hypothetical protein